VLIFGSEQPDPVKKLSFRLQKGFIHTILRDIPLENHKQTIPMRHFIQLALTTLSIATLASCSAPPAPETKVPEAKPPVTTAPATTATPKKAMAFDAKTIAGFKAIQAVASKTETAVEAGDFAAAAKDFEGFETSWKPVEDGVMKISPAFYAAVEKAAKASEAGLKAKDKPGTIKALKELNNTLQSGSKP
jgi:hypothetical protein